MTNKNDGDHIQVGNISGSQGIAIGRNARATVTGHNISGDVKIDPDELRTTLEEMYTSLSQANLPQDKMISTQTAVGQALEGVHDSEVQAETVVSHIQKVGEVLKQANVTVQEGSSLGQSVQKLITLLGPLVGGARIVAGWFGVPFPL